LHLERRHVRERRARVACREHHPNWLGRQTTSHERQRQRRGIVEPLRVIDDAQQRTLLRRLGQQTQHRERYEEPILGRAGAHAEHDLQSLTLRGRETRQSAKKRRAELMENRVGHLHLHPHRLGQGQARRRLDT
jgi:hypothetical protein